MNILYLASDIPRPVEQTGNCMAFEYLRALARKHRVHLLAFHEGRDTLQYVPELRRMCADVEVFEQPIRLRNHGFMYPYMLIRSLFSKHSYKLKKFYNKAFADRVEVLASGSGYSCIHMDHLQMAQFLPKRTACKTILHAHNVESDILRMYMGITRNPFAKLYVGLDRTKLASFEREVMTHADMVWTFSERDERKVSELTDGRARTGVVPLCVNHDYWMPRPAASHPNLIYTASMSTPGAVDGAVWFLREVFPRIKDKVPGCRLFLVGRDPLPVLRQAHNGQDIVVTGYVEDVRPFFGEAQVAVVPMLYGGGVKTKTIISMAMGLPVVCTSVGGEGIGIENGKHLRIEDAPEGFASAVTMLLEDAGMRQQMGQAGRAFALEHHTFEKVEQAIARHYGSMGLGPREEAPTGSGR